MATIPLENFLNNLEARIANVENILSVAPKKKDTAVKNESEVPFLTDYDEYCMEKLEPFIEVCKKLGEGVSSQADIVKKAWLAQKSILIMASKCKRPSPEAQPVFFSKLMPIQETMKEAKSAISRNEWENHGKTVHEGLSCLNWLTVSPPNGLPKETVESSVGGSDYWSNKIRVAYKKNGPPEQIAFCDTFKDLIKGLVEYVVKHHKSGLEWNPHGVDISDYSEEKVSVQDSILKKHPKMGIETPNTGSLFGELNKGLGVTAGLKKVTKDKQTWREEFKGESAPVKNPLISKSKPAANKPKGIPKCEFVSAGNKWVIENQSKDDGTITIQIKETKHSAYIYGCIDAIIDIQGKGKNIVIDNCKKTKIFMDECISSVEVVNCKSIQLQVRGKVPTIAIDKTDGFLCYLSSSALGTVFSTSKSSEMNINFPKPNGADDELMELPLPEQFMHSLENLEDGGSASIKSEVSSLYSH
mmetsp:Transcript_799/g.1168  ORF Transcript_799/g.1168 Transcript_799/m.1168 type:complete len:472 (-) Transcript_799:19-1434(-)